MSPSAPMDNIPDGSAYNAIVCGYLPQRLARFPALPNLGDYVLCQLRKAVAGTTCGARAASDGLRTNRIASLTETISHIVGRCSQEQMGWANADAIVAVVANQHSNGNGSIEAKGESVGGNNAEPIMDVSVAIGANVPAPCPASPQFGNVRRNGASLIDTAPKELNSLGVGILWGHRELILSGVMGRAVNAAPSPYFTPNGVIYA